MTIEEAIKKYKQPHSILITVEEAFRVSFWLEELLAYRNKEKRMADKLEKLYADWSDELSDSDIISFDDDEITKPFHRSFDPILDSQVEELLGEVSKIISARQIG